MGVCMCGCVHVSVCACVGMCMCVCGGGVLAFILACVQ